MGGKTLNEIAVYGDDANVIWNYNAIFSTTTPLSSHQLSSGIF